MTLIVILQKNLKALLKKKYLISYLLIYFLIVH